MKWPKCVWFLVEFGRVWFFCCGFLKDERLLRTLPQRPSSSSPATMFCMDRGQFLDFPHQILLGRRCAAHTCKLKARRCADQAKSRTGAYFARSADVRFAPHRL